MSATTKSPRNPPSRIRSWSKFLDTADTYGIDDNEELIGKTIRPRRDEVFFATKFANIRKKEDPLTHWSISGKPEYVKAACDASPKRIC